MATKTYSQAKEDVSREWFVVDASGLPVGRLATRVARALVGKDKPTYTPHTDGGDYVVVTNASKVKLTGKKSQEMKYRHSGYPGGISSVSKGQQIKDNPARFVEDAVRGMIPKNKLLNERMKRLKVYPGDEHEHSAQKPKTMEIQNG